MSVDMSDAFDPDWFSPVDINRPASGSWVDGKWVDGAASVVQVQMVIVKPSGKDLLVLPEALRTESVIKMHTLSEVHGVSEEDESTADKFEYRGKQYMVHSVFDQAIGQYYKALATRQNA